MRKFVSLLGTGAVLAAVSVVPATGVASAHSMKKCVVPKVVGMSLATAKTDIVAAKCKVGSIANVASKKVAKGYVISESPKAGTKGSSSTKVNLTVSKGKK